MSSNLLPSWRLWGVLLAVAALVAVAATAIVLAGERDAEPPAAVERTPAPRDEDVEVEEEAEEEDEPGHLQRALEGLVQNYPAQTALYVKHLLTGETVAVRADERFRSASLYKLFVLYVAYKDIEAGHLDRDEVLTLSPEAFASEAYPDWAPGTQATVTQALESMITDSGNSAAAMLIERLGGDERINSEMRALGLEQSMLTDAAYTSAEDIGVLLELILIRRAVSASASQEMLALLQAQERDEMLPYPLPFGVRVAHKTGELANLRNDAGIVFAPSGPYIFVALVSEAPTDADAHMALVELSRLSYEHFEGPLPLQGAEPLEEQEGRG